MSKLIAILLSLLFLTLNIYSQDTLKWNFKYSGYHKKQSINPPLNFRKYRLSILIFTLHSTLHFFLKRYKSGDSSNVPGYYNPKIASSNLATATKNL